MNERSQLILKALIEHYIREGEPVGSRVLAEQVPLGLSAATVRNVLAHLEEQGYLYAPHTSAGRVPTEQGYRFFVDCLLTIQPIGQSQVERLRHQLQIQNNVHQLINQASHLLSGFTYHVSLVTVPKVEQLRLRHIEFLSLSENEVLVILVLNDRDVQNRIIRTERFFTPLELEQASNYLNSEFSGKDLCTVRQELLMALTAEKETMNSSMQSLLDMSASALAIHDTDEDVVVAGQANLVNIVSEQNKNRLRTLLDAFTQKGDVLHLLDRCLQTEGLQIFIGMESGHSLLQDCSMITSTYKVHGKVVGVMGVLGPTRMQYEKVIPIVDVTAQLLGASLSLNSPSKPPY